MANPTILNRDQIIDFVIIMLHLHWQVPGEPTPNPEWSRSFKAIAQYMKKYPGGDYSAKTLKEAWVMINKDYYNPDRKKSAWFSNAPMARPAEPWNETVAPLSEYVTHFREDEDLRSTLEERILEVQQRYGEFWEGRDRSIQWEAEKGSKEQEELRDQAYNEIRQISGYDPKFYRQDPWPQSGTYYHLRPPPPT
ncbi:MAG: hypothetical protein Q9174_001244 [Haloplaca sp. 1 TL-2023]